MVGSVWRLERDFRTSLPSPKLFTCICLALLESASEVGNGISYTNRISIEYLRIHEYIYATLSDFVHQIFKFQ